jgi:hypothetical protein
MDAWEHGCMISGLMIDNLKDLKYYCKIYKIDYIGFPFLPGYWVLCVVEHHYVGYWTFLQNCITLNSQ